MQETRARTRASKSQKDNQPSSREECEKEKQKASSDATTSGEQDESPAAVPMNVLESDAMESDGGRWAAMGGDGGDSLLAPSPRESLRQ